MSIEEKYKQLCETPSDINEHLPTLKKYACLCDSIVELGVRGMVSTWALLAGLPLEMDSVDIVHPSEHGGNVEKTKEMVDKEGIDWRFIMESSLDIKFKRTDLLFIDTIHTYEQLIKELKLHAPRTTKYIIMHDTNFPEMQRAINEFLANDNDWKVKEVFTNNNGLTILQRT